MPWQALAGIASSALGIGGTASANYNSQKFARERYNVERANALVDWNRQNKYNSPQAQMARFQEAGLNPHLIYGQGSAGNSGAVSQAKTQSAKFDVADFSSIPQSIASHWDTKIKQATFDNLKEQGNNIYADTMLKLAQTSTTDQTGWMTGAKRDKYETSMEYWNDAATETHRQLMQKGQIQNELYSQSKSNTRIKEMEALLADNGVFKGSNMFNSIMGFMLKGIQGIKKPNFSKYRSDKNRRQSSKYMPLYRAAKKIKW